MNHQARNWIIVLLVLGGILLVRGLMSSHGFGKIYVQEVEKSFVEVEVPPLVPPVMEDGVVQTPDSSAAPELVTEWLPANSPEVEDFATGSAVKVSGWLVSKDDFRLTRQSSRHCDTLLLTSG